MATIVHLSRTGARRPENGPLPMRPATILLFSGVRYERLDGPAGDPAETGRYDPTWREGAASDRH
jgi:hypothetical protein